jgi:CheY-like chemotaxis protein/anti-sigma regulatory factor (Ser/Thr protein kinase)
LLRSLAAARRLTVTMDVAPELGEVIVDPARLKQVLYNFLSNALKFTPQEGRVDIRVRAEGGDDFRIEVRDTGIGIRPENMARLFVEFQQLDAGSAKEYPGTGLGLALTKRIVEAQGGRVGVESRYGEGSLFFAILPRVCEVLSEADAGPSSAAGRAPSILVIEDDPRDRDWLVDTLSRAGYTIETAGSGAAAIARARTRAFDAITLDLLLPDMSGQEVLRAIRRDGPNRDTPVIVATVVADRGVSAGFEIADVLMKPVDASHLLGSVARIVAARDRSRPILIIDDNPLALKLAQEQLRNAGFSSICSSDGEAGLEAIERHAPAAIVLDLVMPAMSGFDFLRRLRRHGRHRHIPVIVWTERDITLDERRHLLTTTERLVPKGDGPGSLIEELRQCLLQTHRTPI